MVVEPRPPSVSLFTILLNIFISYKAFYSVSIILYFFDKSGHENDDTSCRDPAHFILNYYY